MTNVTYHNGAIIQNAHVVLIFWGSYWEGNTSNPSVQAIQDSISSILTGTYMSMRQSNQLMKLLPGF